MMFHFPPFKKTLGRFSPILTVAYCEKSGWLIPPTWIKSKVPLRKKYPKRHPNTIETEEMDPMGMVWKTNFKILDIQANTSSGERICGPVIPSQHVDV